MSITLNGITLPPDLNWVDRFSTQPLVSTRRRTLSGDQIIYHQGLVAGQQITLVATQDTGWIQYSVVQSLKSLHDGSPELDFVLSFHGETHQCRFRYDEPPALQLAPLRYRQTYAADDYFIGTIKLVTITT